MNIKEKKEVTELKTVTVGYKCDCCGKEHKGEFPDEWHDFSSCHYEWGNDSVDSLENHQVCSPECYIDKLKEVVNGDSLSERYDGKIDGMELQFARKIVDFFVSNIKTEKP